MPEVGQRDRAARLLLGRPLQRCARRRSPPSAAVAAGLPEGRRADRRAAEREELAELATQSETVDLIIPRGGEGLKAALQAVATVPVIYAASGNCHVYIDASADLEAAEAVVLNAKTQRPGVCNALETLLVHEQIAPAVLPGLLRSLAAAGVLIRADRRTLALAAAHGLSAHEDQAWPGAPKLWAR